VDEFGVVSRQVDLLRDDPSQLKVFEIIGLAGVGKTRFLAEIRDRLGNPKHSHMLWVGLSGEASATAVGPLRVLRSQLPFDCLLFDAALLTYWFVTGQTPQPLPGRGQAKSLVMRSVEIGGVFAGVPLPLTFAADLYKGVGRGIVKRRQYSREAFEAIDALRDQPEGLFARLPHYLGLDVERRLVKGRALVCFYDAYEKQASRTVLADAPWLRELIATIGQGVHLIATRDRLGWDRAEWEGTLDQVVLGVLPEEECRGMMREQLGELGATVEARLLQASGQIPFFLQATIDVCRSLLDERGAVTADDLPASSEAAVEHLLDHLDPDERTLAIVLACLQHFDEALYGHLVRSLNLPISVTDLDDFVQWFFILGSEAELFRTHDLLTDFVRESSILTPIKVKAMEEATNHLLARVRIGDVEAVERVLELLHSLVAAWQHSPEISDRAIEGLVDIAYRLYDDGQWQALTTLPVGPARTDRHPASVVADFFQALSVRRGAGPMAALAALEHLEADRPLLAGRAASFDLEVAYLSELTGNYARAREEFRMLSEAAEPFNPSRREHVRARLYYADMLIMDGRFVDASLILVVMEEAVGPDDPLTWAELVRHRGHANRFSFDMTTAEALYLRALQVVGSSPSMRAKLMTNLAETRCWSLPDHAVDAAHEASRANEEVGNALEVAKCDAARAVALARLGELDRARRASSESRRRFEALHYPAGVAFALQTRAVIEALAHDEVTDTAYPALVASVESLGTYRHLVVGPAWMRGEAEEFARRSEPVQWLAEAELRPRLVRLLGSPP